MSDPNSKTSADVLADLHGLLGDLEAVYKDLHAHPELSMQELRTAGVAADRLRAAGYEVTTGIGNTGVVGLLRNGQGPTVMLRADMDALPVQEATGLPYASKVTATDSAGKSVPVMHACGHDMHVAWLIGAATLLAKARDAWKGALMPVFQPAEEIGLRYGGRGGGGGGIKNRKDPNVGFNASTEQYEDLVKAGVIDPTKVTRTALQNAASIASLMLTTEAMISARLWRSMIRSTDEQEITEAAQAAGFARERSGSAVRARSENSVNNSKRRGRRAGLSRRQAHPIFHAGNPT